MAEAKAIPPGEFRANDAAYDAETLADLTGLLGWERLADMLARLHEEIARHLHGVADDNSAIGQGAHALVSASGTLGFLPLSRTCAALERACFEGVNVVTVLAAARVEASRAQEAIVKLRLSGV